MSERRVRAGGRSASGDREVLEGPLRARAWTSCCARQMSSMPLISLNSDVAWSRRAIRRLADCGQGGLESRASSQGDGEGGPGSRCVRVRARGRRCEGNSIRIVELDLTAQVSMSSGSDHMRSQKAAFVRNLSCLRSISRIWSIVRALARVHRAHTGRCRPRWRRGGTCEEEEVGGGGGC